MTSTIAEVSHNELLLYDLVEVLPSGALLLSDKKSPPVGELGTTGMTSYGSFNRGEYNSSLQGTQGRVIYDKMRKSDGQCRAILRLIKTPVLAARWYIEPASDSKRDQKIAEFVSNCCFKWMSTSWPQFLLEALICLDFGFSAFEKVFTTRPVRGFHSERVIWQKLAPRHPLDLEKFEYDENGGPRAIRLYDSNARNRMVTEIPIEKMVVFTYDKEGGDMEGVSALRPAYKHWYYKDNLYKVDAIQKERHGIGIPLIKLPPGWQDIDRTLADEIGRNLRTNEKAHVVLPPNWELYMLKLEGQPVDAIPSIEHHDLLIARNVLGQFINAEFSTNSSESVQSLFLKATRHIAEMVRDVFNKYAIPELVGFNWPNIEDFPELRVRRIGDTVDWRTISFAMRNFVGAGILVPDDNLEKWTRDEMDLPIADTATQRIIVAPQDEGEIPDGPPDANPGPGTAGSRATRENGGVGSSATSQRNRPGVPQAGLPRQAKAGNTRNGPGSNGRVGRDGSRS